MKRFFHPHPSLAACGLAALLLLLPACGGSEMSAIPDKHTHPLPDAAPGEYPISIDDLEAMLPTVAISLTWTVVNMDNQVTALHAQLVTADAKPIDVRAQQIGQPLTAVQIKFGRFGNAEREAAFHNALAQRIAYLKSRIE